MGTVGWLLTVAVAIALGYSVGRLWPGSAARLTALERERDAAREDLRIYREEVSSHFERTAELFDKVTADYRGLYEHLSMSARQLGAIRGEAEDRTLARPEQRRLAEVAGRPPVDEPPAPQPERNEQAEEAPAVDAARRSASAPPAEEAGTEDDKPEDGSTPSPEKPQGSA